MNHPSCVKIYSTSPCGISGVKQFDIFFGTKFIEAFNPGHRLLTYPYTITYSQIIIKNQNTKDKTRVPFIFNSKGYKALWLL